MNHNWEVFRDCRHLFLWNHVVLVAFGFNSALCFDPFGFVIPLFTLKCISNNRQTILSGERISRSDFSTRTQHNRALRGGEGCRLPPTTHVAGCRFCRMGVMAMEFISTDDGGMHRIVVLAGSWQQQPRFSLIRNFVRCGWLCDVTVVLDSCCGLC